MKTVPMLLEDYLVMRRTFGAKLEDGSRLLHHFVDFLAARGAAFMTTELALEWATLPQEALPPYRARRLAEVRHFAQYARAIDPRHEMPPEGLLPSGSTRAHPYIYSDEEVTALIGAARDLRGQIRPLTYATILGLLSVTGMRSGEVVALDRDDIDLQQGLITIRNTKFNKSRLVACHDTTCRALDAYAIQRNRTCSGTGSAAFFLSEQAGRISAYTLRETFAKLCRTTGLREAGDRKGPRLHDLRHSFAVRTLMQWYREDGDVERCLPRLSTWLGHVSISNTYWYLTAVPELMELVARRLDRVQERAEP